MPRKNKRSQAQSRLRQQTLNKIHSATTEQAEGVGPHSSQVKTSGSPQAQSETHVGQHDASCVSPVSCADIVKKGVHSDDPCVAGPSHASQVNHRGQSDVPEVSYADVVKRGHPSDASCVPGPSRADCVEPGYQPSVTSVCASRSQASHKYGEYRNKQCTCNSLTFLAFL